MKTKILAAAVAGAAVLAACGTAALYGLRPAGQVANVYVDGVCVQSIDLTREAGRYTVAGAAGKNVIEYGGGHLRVVEADCPDGVCIARGDLAARAEPIVCLPNRVVIRLERAAKDDIDAVAG